MCMEMIPLKDELWEMWIPRHKRNGARDGWGLQLPSTAPRCWVCDQAVHIRRTPAIQKWTRDHPDQQ